MSFYATISGRIRYLTREALDSALTFLRQNQWMNDRNVFINERGQPITSESTLRGMTLVVPSYLYRNLAGSLDRILAGSEHRIAWASIDGKYAAGVIVNGKETTFDLQKWAAEHLEQQEEDEEPDDLEAEFINWAEWKWEFRSLASHG